MGIKVFLFYSSAETLEGRHKEQFPDKHSGLAACIPTKTKVSFSDFTKDTATRRTNMSKHLAPAVLSLVNVLSFKEYA